MIKMSKPITMKKSQAQEKRVSKDIQGNVQIASGSIWCFKGDVVTEHFLVECKTTKNKSYRLTLNTWNKIFKEAISSSMRQPCMIIDLLDNYKHTTISKFVVDYRTFNDLDNYKELVESLPLYEAKNKSFLIDSEDKLVKLDNCTLIVLNYTTAIEYLQKYYISLETEKDE